MEECKSKVCKSIDEKKGELLTIARGILEHPELGFKEENTANLVKISFDKMGIKYRDKLALTGVKATIPGKDSSPNIAVLGELDAVISPAHPYANKKTGAAHACGHFTMITNLIGLGFGLLGSGIMKDLNGSVTLFAVPAEEYLEIEFRKKLIGEGKLEFLGGKQELIRLGEFDDVDIAMMFHPAPNAPNRVVQTNVSMNGFIGKIVRYIGKGSHAGATPEEGVNALSAAMLGLQSVNSLRETFKDDDCIRVHPIITKGGEGVSTVPSDVRIESYVRAKSMDALMETNKKVNRALEAGAMAIGCDIEIDDLPGYMPLITNDELARLWSNNASQIIGRENVIKTYIHSAGSSDMGDVTHVIPGIHPMVGGFVGGWHAKDFRVMDEEMALIIPAKIMAMTIVDLLYGDANPAKRISKERRSKEEYLSAIRSMGGTIRKKYMS